MSSTVSEKAVPVRFQSENAVGTGRAVLEIGGADITKYARGVVIRASVGSLATVDVEAFARDGLDITLPAAVTVLMQPLEAGYVDATTLADGTVRYRFVRGRSDDDS